MISFSVLYIAFGIFIGCAYGWVLGSGELISDIIIDELKEINKKLDEQ